MVVGTVAVDASDVGSVIGSAINYSPLYAVRLVGTLDRTIGFGTYCLMRGIYFPILAVLCWAAPALAMPLPDCAGPVLRANANVLRISDDGGLVLGDGRIALLEGIRLPDRGPLKAQALARLAELSKDGVTLTAVPPGEDRYGRMRVQGFGHDWMQVTLLEEGLARVDIAPDRNDCAPDLYEAEDRARARHRGGWAQTAWSSRSAQQMTGTVGTFQIVDGWVANVGASGGRAFIDFSSDWRHGFSAIIAPGDRRAFKYFDLDGLMAKHVRIRGLVQSFRGRPQIALSNPAQIEVLN